MQEKILQFIRMKGPVLPSQVAKLLETDIIIASAHLSEMVSNNKLELSRLKVGGSPLYYLQGQEEKLLNFIDNLDPKDKKTLNLLKEKKILREKELDLFTRVSLRNIPDFAKSLTVTINDQKEIFWKWFLISKEEAINLIKEKVKPPEKKEIKPVQEEKDPPQLKNEKSIKNQEEETKDKEKIKKKEENQEEKPEQKEKKETNQKEKRSKFLEKVYHYFQEKNIQILEKNITRKDTEAGFVIEIPTAIGKVKYFCKARNKKKCNDKDVSQAFAQGKIKQLPILFLYTKDITKKGQDMVNQFDNLKIKKLPWD